MRLTLSFLLIFTFLGCTESKVNRKLPGSWSLVSHSYVDEFGFTINCANSSGNLVLGNCKKGDCTYSINYNYPCINTGDQVESGTFMIESGGDNFLLFRENVDATIDTIEHSIMLLTNTDLKINYYEPTEKRRHMLVLSR